MEEEKRIEQTNSSGTDTNQDYISAIKEIKENSVSKEDYLKVREENKKLLQSLVEGTGSVQSQEDVTPKPSVAELRSKLGKEELSNLDYITTSLQLRQELIDAGEKDPFTPIGKNIVPTPYDVQEAQHVADVLQECVDIAEGDSDIFTNELQRRLVDSVPLKRKK